LRKRFARVLRRSMSRRYANILTLVGVRRDQVKQAAVSTGRAGVRARKASQEEKLGVEGESMTRRSSPS
jgi:hypothetical protein